MANYLVFPDDAEQGVPKFFSSLKTAKVHAATLARGRNLNVRVWKENLKTGLMTRAATVRPAYLRKNPCRRNPSILDHIRAGMRVTIVDRFGKEHSGRAVMRGPGGWVLNMGGPHGTPGIADERNIVKVSGKPSGIGGLVFSGRRANPAIPSQWTPVSITRKGKQIQIRTRGR